MTHGNNVEVVKCGTLFDIFIKILMFIIQHMLTHTHTNTYGINLARLNIFGSVSF
jgi:hypothetical protein